jgi:hypothetical protein
MCLRYQLPKLKAPDQSDDRRVDRILLKRALQKFEVGRKTPYQVFLISVDSGGCRDTPSQIRVHLLQRVHSMTERGAEISVQPILSAI